jgi:hypothetical protein
MRSIHRMEPARQRSCTTESHQLILPRWRAYHDIRQRDVAGDAVEFYQRCGFTIGSERSRASWREPVYMSKALGSSA